MNNNNDNETVASSEQRPRKPRKLKTRQVSSRFLSPISSPKHNNKNDILNIVEKPQSPRQSNSPMQRKPPLNRSRTTLADHLVRRSNYDNTKGNVTLKENIKPNSTTPGRLSLDDVSRRNSDLFIGASSYRHFVSSNCSTRKAGKQVMSRYLDDLPARHRVMTPDISTRVACSSVDEDTGNSNKFSLKDIMFKRSNSTSRWALSPGRSGFSPLSRMHPSNSSPPKSKRMGKLLDMGRRLFKSRKGLVSCKTESIHQLRLLHNCLVQLRYANARSNVVNELINRQAQRESICVWNSLWKLQCSILQKRLQLQREKLEMKLNLIIPSQIDKLEAWKDLEDESVTAVSVINDCLYSIASRLPLTEDAQVDSKSMLIALQELFDVMMSIDLTIISSSPLAEQTVSLISRLANVVAQENLLLEEASELLETVSMLELQERSLMCSIIQLTDQQKQIEEQK